MFIAICAALVIGIALGLLGAGGSILTVPLLIYALDMDETLAVTSSLFIVSVIAAATLLLSRRWQTIAWPWVCILASVGALGAGLGAWLAHGLATWIQLTTLALLMLTAGAHMLKRSTNPVQPTQPSLLRALLQGLILGMVSGFVGIGGGFLIVPMLVSVAGLNMPVATLTSLAVIAANGMSGFVFHLLQRSEQAPALPWKIMLLISLVGVAGGYLGQRLQKHLPQEHIKRLFAVLLGLMAVGIFIDTLIEYF